MAERRHGFDGVAAADYGAVSNVYHAQGVTENEAEAGLMCMEAGMDVEQQIRVCYNDGLKEMFASGEADIKILDRAVLRVLEAKFRMGLFEHPYALQGEELREIFNREKDKEISLQSALESMVLLKNNGVLPLKQGLKKIAVIGTQAKMQGFSLEDIRILVWKRRFMQRQIQLPVWSPGL